MKEEKRQRGRENMCMPGDSVIAFDKELRLLGIKHMTVFQPSHAISWVKGFRGFSMNSPCPVKRLP